MVQSSGPPYVVLFATLPTLALLARSVSEGTKKQPFAARSDAHLYGFRQSLSVIQAFRLPLARLSPVGHAVHADDTGDGLPNWCHWQLVASARCLAHRSRPLKCRTTECPRSLLGAMSHACVGMRHSSYSCARWTRVLHAIIETVSKPTFAVRRHVHASRGAWHPCGHPVVNQSSRSATRKRLVRPLKRICRGRRCRKNRK